MAKRLLAHVALWAVLLVAASINMASACTCMMSHPQKHYCQADFVVGLKPYEIRQWRMNYETGALILFNRHELEQQLSASCSSRENKILLQFGHCASAKGYNFQYDNRKENQNAPEQNDDMCSIYDLFIVARVKKVLQPDAMSRVYKVNIKKEFKMTQKARILLKERRLVTSGSSSMCGVDVRLEETYLMTGRVVSGQAYINLCNYITPWAQLSVRQKKGFRLLYRQGCSCEVIDCPWWRQCSKDKIVSDACLWETSLNSDSSLPDCQANHGICMKTPSGNCGWSTDKNYRQCMKNRRRIRDEKLRKEP